MDGVGLRVALVWAGLGILALFALAFLARMAHRRLGRFLTAGPVTTKTGESRWSTIVLSALFSVIAFSAVEIVMRVNGWPVLLPNEEVTELDPDLLWRNRRNLSVSAFPSRSKVTTNSAGFRHRPLPVVKPEGEKRVFCLGDSIAFGFGVADGEPYADRLEVKLNAARKGEGGKKFEVVNAGVLGYTTFQGLRQLRDRVLAYDPDLIVVSYGMNDGDYCWDRFHFQGRSMKEIRGPNALMANVRNVLFNNSALCRGLLKMHFRLMEWYWGSAHADKAWCDPAPLVTGEEYMANLRAIVRAASKCGARAVFFPPPVQFVASALGGDWPERAGRAEADEGTVRKIRAGIEGTRDAGRLAELYGRLGCAYRKLSRYEPALEAFRESIRHEAKVARPSYRALALAYGALMRRVAAEEGVPLADITGKVAKLELAKDPEDLFADPYHLGPLGHRIAADELFRVIGEKGLLR